MMTGVTTLRAPPLRGGLSTGSGDPHPDHAPPDGNAGGNERAGVVPERVVAQPCRGRNMARHLMGYLA